MSFIDYLNEREGWGNYIGGIIYGSICSPLVIYNKLFLIPSVLVFLLMIHYGLQKHSFG